MNTTIPNFGILKILLEYIHYQESPKSGLEAKSSLVDEQEIVEVHEIFIPNFLQIKKDLELDYHDTNFLSVYHSKHPKTRF